jgi:hypothetical protein
VDRSIRRELSQTAPLAVLKNDVGAVVTTTPEVAAIVDETVRRWRRERSA